MITQGVNARMIVSSYKRICDLPLGKRLNFGNTVEKGKNIFFMEIPECAGTDPDRASGGQG